jgi:hypothetical protein
MPRHPPNALTSRLRIHTINDNLHVPALLSDVDDNLSQIIIVQRITLQPPKTIRTMRHGID